MEKARKDRGYMMAALLVSLAVMGILMAVALPTWRHMMQREREAELIFRGEQYARAVGLFQRKFAGAFPPSVDMLIQQKFLRKKYKDPMVPDGEFQVLYQTSASQQPGATGMPGAAPGGIQAPSEDQDTGPRPGLSPGRAPSPGPGGTVGTTPGQVGGGPGRAIGTAGPSGGVIGVTSKSSARSIRLYKGRGRYNEWQFLYTDVRQTAGAPGAQTPGGPGGSGTGPSGAPGTGRPGAPGRSPMSRPGDRPFAPGGGFRTPGQTKPPGPPSP